jgi:hypothetical protein
LIFAPAEQVLGNLCPHRGVDTKEFTMSERKAIDNAGGDFERPEPDRAKVSRNVMLSVLDPCRSLAYVYRKLLAANSDSQ